MLEGITVLNQEMIMGMPDWLLNGSVKAFICILIIAIVYLIGLIFDFDSIRTTAGWLIVICMTITILIICITPDVPTGRYRYEVTIDESVSFNDIYERYEIVEQRGDIWVLEEKENEP